MDEPIHVQADAWRLIVTALQLGIPSVLEADAESNIFLAIDRFYVSVEKDEMAPFTVFESPKKDGKSKLVGYFAEARDAIACANAKAEMSKPKTYSSYGSSYKKDDPWPYADPLDDFDPREQAHSKKGP